MKPRVVIIDRPEDTAQLIDQLLEAEYVAYDCETTGLNQQDEIIGISICMDETVAYYLIISGWSATQNKLVYKPGMREACQEIVQMLAHKNVICHNAIFDAIMAKAYFKVDLINAVHTDTMVLAHLLDENRSKGLKELATIFYGDDAKAEQAAMKASVTANGGKLTKACYEMYKADERLMAEYGALDSWYTLKLFYDLVPELMEQGLDDYFYKDECMPLLRGPTYEMNYTGLQVDIPKMQALQKTLQAEIHELNNSIAEEVRPHVIDKYPGTNKKNQFNIGSNQQLAWLLFGVLDLEFNTLNKGGKEAADALGLRKVYSKGEKNAFIARCREAAGGMLAPEGTVNGKKVKAKKFKEPWAYITVDEKTLVKLAPKYKFIGQFLEMKKKEKLLGTYVDSILARMKYGVIRPTFNQCGTDSGRYSSQNPNFQNLPKKDKRIKHCLVARPGRTFVGADFSQLEIRVFASISGDKNLQQTFTTGDDFYAQVATNVWGLNPPSLKKDEFVKKYESYRDKAKVIALAAPYGATSFQLAKTTGKSKEETQTDINAYFEAFPEVKGMMLRAYEKVKKHGAVHNIFGRPRRLPDAKKIDKIYGTLEHEELPYEARKLLNIAVNNPIQGTGGAICNRSMIKYCNDRDSLGLEAPIVMQVHDEVIVECREEDAETISMLLQNAMETAVELPGVALEAIPATAKTIGGLK